MTKVLHLFFEFERYCEIGRWLSLTELSVAMLPELCIFCGSIFLFFVWLLHIKRGIFLSLNLFLNLIFVGIFITGCLIFFNPYFPTTWGGYVLMASISFQITYYTQVIKLFMLVLLTIFLVGTKPYFEKIFFFSKYSQDINSNIKYIEYLTIINLTVGFLFLLISVVHFLMLILLLEVVAFCVYILIAFRVTSKYALESVIKYFFFGALTFGLYSVGMLFIYMSTGGLSFYHILEKGPANGIVLEGLLQLDGEYRQEVEIPTLYIIGVLLVFCALLLKLGAVPFHFWVADVYEGAAYPTTIFVGTIVKVGFCGVLLKLCCWIFLSTIMIWQPLFLGAGTLSLIVGSLMAFNQKRIKRFFAYSSIVHIGFFLISLSLIDFSQYGGSYLLTNEVRGNFFSINSFVVSFLYISVYIVTVLCLFLIFMNLIDKKTGVPVIYFTDCQGLLSNSQKTSGFFFVYVICIVFLLLSMAGIPPFLGFFTKYYIFLLAIKFKLFWLLFIMICVTVLSAFYYLRIFKILCFEKVNFNGGEKSNIKVFDSIILVFLISIVSLFVFLFTPWTFFFNDLLIILNKTFMAVYWPELPFKLIGSDILQYTVPYRIPLHYSVMLKAGLDKYAEIVLPVEESFSAAGSDSTMKSS